MHDYFFGIFFKKKFIKQEVIFYVIPKKSYVIPCTIIPYCTFIRNRRVRRWTKTFNRFCCNFTTVWNTYNTPSHFKIHKFRNFMNILTSWQIHEFKMYLKHWSQKRQVHTVLSKVLSRLVLLADPITLIDSLYRLVK